ncbi:hypothetical protein [Microbacterium sediminis]|uniref:Uncharacterized protein n=1 Tax=Microbacterium sediminis TaxID=904291 RepID=A0A1B9NAD2_9MICO|nr:hypothetical protein [Microbacterium sediminis]OCG73559.1 hypothetical protein A7J15_07745 [Microbacterium sediminis]QBR73234.1 hypothetical protein E3O41_01465 [Microbacterium sediminis]
MTTQPAPAAARLRILRTIAIAYLGAIPMIGIVLTFITPADDPWGAPDLLGIVVPLAIGAAAWIGVLTFGLRMPALPARDVEIDRTAGLGAYQTTLFQRVAVAMLPALVSVALQFALPHATLITYAIGGVISLVLVAVYVYPNRYNVRLVERRLDRDGARSGLSQSLGFDGGPEAPSNYTGSATFH